MKQEITKGLADGAAALAVSGGIATKLGWFEFINANAPALGFIASCVFGIVATVFYFLTYAKSKQADKNKEGLESLETAFNEHKTETNDQFKYVNKSLDTIINKLGNN